MRNLRKIFRGLSFRFDALFFRNITLIISSVLIWRGIWNFCDQYLFPGNFLMSNLFSIAVGIFLLFIFDSEVEYNKYK